MAEPIIIPVYLQPVKSEGEAAGGGAELPPAPPEERDPAQRKAGDMARSDRNAAKAVGRQMATKVATAALNNFGNLTGDYVSQQNIQTAVGEIGALASSVALGPAGMLLYGTSKAIDAYNYVSQIKRSRTEAEFKQKRVYSVERRS